MTTTETAVVTSESQDPVTCKRCREVACICEYLPASWGPGAHGAYLAYARQQRDLHEHN